MSTKSDNDNDGSQLNPNNDEYWRSRGDERPVDWDEQVTVPADSKG